MHVGTEASFVCTESGVCCPKMCFRGNDRNKIIGSRALQTRGSSWLGVDNQPCLQLQVFLFVLHLFNLHIVLI